MEIENKQIQDSEKSPHSKKCPMHNKATQDTH